VTRTDDDAASGLAIDAPGLEENTTLAWPLLLRRRVADRLEASERYPWLVLATVLTGLFAVGSTITILAIAVPSIATDLGSDDSTISWVTTGPILAFAVCGPLAGKLADVRGLRRAYLVSLGGAALFAVLTALAPTAFALIAFRVLGAAIGAATGPASLAIINRLFSPSQRAQALGFWAMVAAGGPVIGAIIGAPIVEGPGWRWIFVIQAPLMLACLVVAAIVLPTLPPRQTEDGRTPRIDGWGAATLGLGAVSLLLAVNRGAVWGLSHPVVLGALALAVVGFGAFVAVERRVESPLLPLAYLRRRNFTVPIASQFFTNFAYMGAFAITPLLLQNEFGHTATEAAWLSIPRPLVFAIAGPVAGYLTVRVGERSAGVFGAAAIAASMVALSTLDPADGSWTVIGALALSGLGMGAASPAMAASVANAVDDHDLGIAGATQQMVNQIGVAIGMQLMLAVQTAREDAVGAVAAYGEAYLLAAVMASIGVVFATFVRSSRRDEGVPGGDALVLDEPAAAGLVAATATR
jgi:EmrB/QacA subfamily drug resistance transporter